MQTETTFRSAIDSQCQAEAPPQSPREVSTACATDQLLLDMFFPLHTSEMPLAAYFLFF